MSTHQPSSPPRRGERLFIAVLIIFSAAALWQAWLIAGFSKLSSPGVFPMLAASVMLVSGLCALRGKTSTEPDSRNTGSSPPAASTDDEVLPARVALMAVLLVLYVLAMPLLGFLLDSGLFLLAGFSYLWKRPFWVSLVLSLVSLLVIHLLFRVVFQVILPSGVLSDLLF